MCDSTLAIYCFIDDFLKASGHREDIRIEVTDAEVITIALTAMLHFGGNFEKSRLLLHELGLVKRLLSRSRFSRRLNRLADFIYQLFHQLGASLKELHWESRYLLDSFPVPLCDNIRIKRCRLVQDELYRGKMASKRRYFYGVRVQIMTTSDGLPLEFCILPGACSDLQGLAELALDLPEKVELFVDGGYNFYEWEDYLREIQDVRFQVPRRVNSKRGREPWLEIYKSLMRKYIETTIGEIAKLFPKKIHATNLNGFMLKIALFLFAYQVDKAFIQ
ncbi:MAG: IS982 family transposase [Acidobacteriota bacterium]|nr:IS982 family transposase [Acidobacteriota bacterium]